MKSRAALRLALPVAVDAPVAKFDYRSLTELHYALHAADDAVQMARGLPRFDDQTLIDMAADRDARVVAALARLREVLP